MRLLTIPATRSEDILVVRAAARAVGAGLGLDDPDMVRLATALSEVGREVFAEGPCEVSFNVDGLPAPAIVVTFVSAALDADEGRDGRPGLAAARRLVDAVDVQVRDRTATVSLIKVLPPRLGRVDLAALAVAVRAAVPRSPIDELATQNRELAAALVDVRAKEQEALRLNAELAETNRGVMAMYAELSEELDETNRGVVALYAELDEKGLQLQAAGLSKSRFFTAVSHELRSPVNSILGLARVLREPDADPLTDEQRHQVGLVEAAAHDLLRLVNQLLDIAKAEAGRLEPEVDLVDLRQLMAEMRGLLRPLVDEARVELVIDVAPDVPAVETDRTLLSQVLRNLLVNAVRFTEDGEIRITARLADAAQHVVCEVRDTGIGIAPEHLEQVFEEFFQVRGPLQAKTRGSGLGLAHSRRLAAALGAELTVRSEVARGSTFSVVLPVRWNAALASEVVVRSRVTSAVRSVLIVDDDEGFRTALRGMLQGLCERVTEASTGADALGAMTAEQPDLVFLDLRMPDTDGADVLAWMGRQGALRDVPVVIVTSVDLGIELRTALGRAHALVAKSDVSRARVEAVLAGLVGTRR